MLGDKEKMPKATLITVSAHWCPDCRRNVPRMARISNELFLELRKKIRMRVFRSKAHLREHLMNVEKIDLIKKIESTKPKKKTEKKVVKKSTKTGGKTK